MQVAQASPSSTHLMHLFFIRVDRCVESRAERTGHDMLLVSGGWRRVADTSTALLTCEFYSSAQHLLLSKPRHQSHMLHVHRVQHPCIPISTDAYSLCLVSLAAQLRARHALIERPAAKRPARLPIAHKADWVNVAQGPLVCHAGQASSGVGAGCTGCTGCCAESVARCGGRGGQPGRHPASTCTASA